MIYLYGAGGHAKVVIEILERQKKEIAGLLDENTEIRSLLGYPVFQVIPAHGSTTDFKMIICIGKNEIRKKCAEEFKVNYQQAIHPSAILSPRASIGDGTVVMASVTVNCDAVVGRHVILNTNCTIDHDCIVNDFVHISPNAALGGKVQVSEGAHIGIGACVIQGIKIGKWATVGAGAVIIDDVPDYAVVVGNPGKIIKYSDQK
ncbi:acetyltransferase [uncultured Mucilaginibacter sp.]|uniref:acetyltransferase n=1 Tax=uncultured Mucilaginibacter sp. TaxID=797541 RepID=UPI0025F7D1F5|nr:acetyltransferase [uncultured Mucilaginibacter sp.]